ncbi:MAG: hypothetical protein ACT4OE_11270 [Sphingosinicella sp.]
MPIDSEAAYRQIGELIATMPDLRAVDENGGRPQETHRWLGRLHALLNATAQTVEAHELRLAIGGLQTIFADRHIEDIRNIAYRTLAAAEVMAPSAVQGSFIPAGHGFDVFSALSKVLGKAKTDVLIVDPYMDAVTVTDFVPLVPDGVSVRLLSDEDSVYSTLRPAITRYASQFAATRPIEGRVAAPRTLHDRLLLVDRRDAWILTQSLKDFAARAAGSIAAVDAQTAGLKVQAYESTWQASTMI